MNSHENYFVAGYSTEIYALVYYCLTKIACHFGRDAFIIVICGIPGASYYEYTIYAINNSVKSIAEYI